MTSRTINSAKTQFHSMDFVRATACAPENVGTMDTEPFRLSGSGTNFRSSIHTLPFPPDPAVIENSIAATRTISPPPAGPHAKTISRLARVTVSHSRGNTKSRWFDHHTLFHVGSIS